MHCRKKKNSARLENYTFLTPDILTWGLNVYARLEEWILREFSNGLELKGLAEREGFEPSVQVLARTTV